MPANTLQQRMSAFVSWIATDSSTEESIREQAGSIRKRISAKAADDGLTIRSTPNSGSFAKRTGLRRHLRGHSVVDGQDVDLPFVTSPSSESDKQLSALLPRFERYARAAYPDTQLTMTKSSVNLEFSNNLSYDLVPMLATQDPERQILIRADGESRETSVQQHIEFIRSRTRHSNSQAGRVKFNEMVRLFKWWRYHKQDASSVLDAVPTFLIDLLCAQAFDARGVQTGYAETFADWAGYLARTVRKRQTISFSDFGQPQNGNSSATWSVLDPVNSENNIVKSWGSLKCDELADWYEEARDNLYDAIVEHHEGRYSKGMDNLVAVFGSAFKSHCGE